MRLRLLFFISSLIFTSNVVFGQLPFDEFFKDKTMRIDYFHSGTKDKEYFSPDQIFLEGAWAGSIVNLVDTLNLGEYLLRVFDYKSGRLLYSRGYCTVFNEWQTTDEALKGTFKTLSESFRIPFPKNKIQITVSRRDKYQILRELYTTVIDPDDPTQVNKEMHSSSFEVVSLMDNGDIHNKVDIVILGDGYAQKDMEKFRADAKHFNDVMFSTSPFKENKDKFNVRAVCAVSENTGIDIPDMNIWKNTALGTTYNTFGSERYVLTEANKELRNIASQVPYDFVTILLNDNRYGGGGIFQQYTTTYTNEKNPANEWQRDYVYVHEFGHCFGGLGDEYYSSSTGYNDFYPAGVEPWEPNLTRYLDPVRMKWQSLVSESLKIPTDWGKARYDSLTRTLSTMGKGSPGAAEDRKSIVKAQKEIITNPLLLGKVGLFEGAGYVPNGIYRPSLDCRMFSLSLTDFDPVCRAAIERQIEFYTR